MSADQSVSPAVTPKASALLAYLSSHIGADRGVSVEAIARFFNWQERLVRTLVTELREHGHAVCGHPRTGYFIAETAAELEGSCAFLRSRAMKSLTLEARLRRISLPDLLGQLKLTT
jgi:hypothetical protein